MHARSALCWATVCAALVLRVRVTPPEVVIALRDWVDDDETQSAINLADPVNPFASGFSSEDSNYDRFDPRYEAKNARFDSVDELYRIHAKYSANPWATTTAADDQGNTLFTDVGTVPNISNDHAAVCNTPIGHATWNTLGLAVLPGWAVIVPLPSQRPRMFGGFW